MKIIILTLGPTNESKQKIKEDEELWSNLRDLIRSVTKNLDDYDEKYMIVNLIQMTSYL